MRKLHLFIVVISLFFWISNPVLAEYNGHFIDFDIELKSGSVIKAHSYLASVAYMVDTGSYQNYLENRMDLLLRDDFSMDDNSFIYHEYRFAYFFHYPEFDSGVIYSLGGKKYIEMEDVKRLKITQMIEQSYAFIVVNPLTKEDEKWFSQPAVAFANVWDKLNAYDVFIHQESKELTQVLDAIAQESSRYEKIIKVLETDLKYADGGEREEIETQIGNLEELRRHQVGDALGRLFAFKVVIIGYLSC